MDGQNSESRLTKQALENVFDLLLWAEKRNAGVLEMVFQSKLLTLLLDKYSSHLQNLLSGMILLLGNAREEGPLARHILSERLGDKIVLLYL